MSEIKLVTGVLIYEEPALMKTQIEMVKRFLATGYPMLTKEEILHAFYLNMQGAYDQVYKHYNRELNAEFMGDVLRAYLNYKLYLRETKGPQINRLLATTAPKALPYKRVVDYAFWKQLIQEEYDDYRFGRPSRQLWSVRKYYTLRRFGLLPFPKGFKTWVFFFKRVMKGNARGTKLPADANLEHYHFSSFAACRAIFHTHEDYQRCLDYLRRYAYFYVLRACSDCGINDLFTEIAPE
jgi:hypothetical protein